MPPITAALSALRLSGRLMVIQNACPRFSRITLSLSLIAPPRLFAKRSFGDGSLADGKVLRQQRARFAPCNARYFLNKSKGCIENRDPAENQTCAVAGSPRSGRKCSRADRIYCGCKGGNLIPFTIICEGRR